MLWRLGPRYLMAAFLIGSGVALFLLVWIGPPPRRSVVEREQLFLYGMTGFYIWLLVFYRLLIEVCRSGPAPDSSVTPWQPLEAADRQFGPRDEHMFSRAPVVFRISPWPWIKLHGYFIVLPMLGINLLVSALAPPRWQQLSAMEQYMFVIVAIFYAALNAVFFLMHYRLLHFAIGSRACSYRIAWPGSDMRAIVCHYEGSFPLDLVVGLWVREKSSPFRRRKELHYGMTFKRGDEMHLGVTTRNASWTGVSDLQWERLLAELSQRTSIGIKRHTHGPVPPSMQT